MRFLFLIFLLLTLPALAKDRLPDARPATPAEVKPLKPVTMTPDKLTSLSSAIAKAVRAEDAASSKGMQTLRLDPAALPEQFKANLRNPETGEIRPTLRPVQAVAALSLELERLRLELAAFRRELEAMKRERVR